MLQKWMDEMDEWNWIKIEMDKMVYIFDFVYYGHFNHSKG